MSDLRKRWIAALRSGEYQQTTAALKDDRGYCPLGVLCDISGIGRWRRVSYNTPEMEFVVGDDVFYGYSIPQKLLKQAGITRDQCAELAIRNDGRFWYQRHTFLQAADLLEEWSS